jgi:hypothetical protein
MARLILLCFALSSVGCCTFVGANIGDTVPRRGDTEFTADLRSIPQGTDVAVVYRSSKGRQEEGVASPNGSAEERLVSPPLVTIEGVYRGIADDRAIVERGDQAHLIPLSQIEQTRARPWRGSYSLEGGFIGLGLDIATVVFFYGMLSQGWGGR